MTLVRLDNISKSYGSNLVLKDITWQIEEGRKIGLLEIVGRVAKLPDITRIVGYPSETRPTSVWESQ